MSYNMSTNRLGKIDVIEEICKRVRLTRSESRAVYEALFDPETGIISESLQKGVPVMVAGFGLFHSKLRKGRKSNFNVHTGKIEPVEDYISPRFKAYDKFKTIIKEKGIPTEK